MKQILCISVILVVLAGTIRAEIPSGTTSPLKFTESLDFDLGFHHYDAYGYPESSDGRLIVRKSGADVVVPMKQDPYGSLLYAQFVTRQRDAVILSREGVIDDPLPDGTSFRIPYGFGALRMNTAYTSIVEAEAVPHVSDNRKEYGLFPIQDLSVGGMFGFSGLHTAIRYTYTERFFLMFSLGVETFGGFRSPGPMSFYTIPVQIGAGYRSTGIFEQYLGRNNISMGLSIFNGMGDRDKDAATPSFFWLPGIFVEFEKYSYGKTSAQDTFRTDPRPYNHSVNSFFIRLSLYVNTINPLRAELFILDISAGFLLGVLGPSIPEHEFKETKSVYMSDEYREQIERQKKSREERIRGGESR